MSPKTHAYVVAIAVLGLHFVALLVLAGLLYYPLMTFCLGRAVPAWPAWCSLASGLAALSVLLTRRSLFSEPGLRVTAEDQPRLWDYIGCVSRLLEQSPPDEVYLTFEVNAAVSHRGGLLGHGGKRVLVLGLPLLRILTATQFRAALIHEFGHFNGGDIRFSGWIYRTRSSIFNTLQSLPEGLPRRLFTAYARTFLRLSQGLARRQEIMADHLAALHLGSRALTESLEAVQRATPALDPFWAGEVNTVIHAGFLPPLTEGFHRFLQAAPIATQIEQNMEKEKIPRQAQVFDSHPPLLERIEAVRKLPQGSPVPRDPMAISLLDGLARLERLILSKVNSAIKVGELKNVDWSEVGEKVYLPLWQAFVSKHAAALSGLDASGISRAVKNPILLALGSVVLRREERGLTGDDVRSFCVNLLGAGLVLALRREGWELQNAPGEPIKMEKDGKTFLPFDEIRGLIDEGSSAPDWTARCRELGIESVRLQDATQ